MIRPMVVLLLAVASVAQGAESPRERLQMIEGHWTIEGREKTFNERCTWFADRSHMVCNSESRGKSGTVRRGVSVMSYSDDTRRFLYYHYGNSGVVQALDLFVENGVLMATGERSADGALIRTQVRMSPRVDGSFDFLEHESKNAGPWEKTAEVHYIRVTAPID